MSVDSYNTQNYIADNQNTTTVTMPTSQMTIHGICADLIQIMIIRESVEWCGVRVAGTSNNAQIMSMGEQSKSEQLRMYDGGRLFAQSELSAGVLGSQEMLAPYPQPYEQQPAAPDQLHAYAGKSSRLQYVGAQNKIISPQETYAKYGNG